MARSWFAKQVPTGSICRKRNRTAIFAFHDREDLGGPMTAIVAKQFGYTLEELRRMV
jgi:hypothetical protein